MMNFHGKLFCFAVRPFFASTSSPSFLLLAAILLCLSYSVTGPWKIVYIDRWPNQLPSAPAGQI